MKLWAGHKETLFRLYHEGRQQIAAGGKLEQRQIIDAFNMESIRIIPVHGVLFKEPNYITKYGWGTSYQELAGQLSEVEDDQSVKAIGLHIDSPGGEFDGIIELADYMESVRARKPIFAYVSGMAASGGYWIASATDYISAHRASYVGSIGVIATLCDFSEALAKEGIREHVFVSEVSPEKYADISSEDGQKLIQAHIDEAGELFVSEVARNRQIEKSLVLTDFGKGNTMFAEKALKVGMIDAVESMEETFRKISEVLR